MNVNGYVHCFVWIGGYMFGRRYTELVDVELRGFGDWRWEEGVVEIHSRFSYTSRACPRSFFFPVTHVMPFLCVRWNSL